MFMCIRNCPCNYDSCKADDGDTAEKAYASRTTYSEEAYNSYSGKYKKRAKRIAGKIPKSPSTEKKVAWIADYLLKHVTLFDYFDWLDKTNDGQKKSSPEYEKGILADTGYGTLFCGMASEQG